MITDSDLKKMRIKPVDEDTDIRKIFKSLPSFISFKGFSPHKLKVINYILLSFDPESPFVKKYVDIKKRRDAVSDYTGLSNVKKETSDQVMGYSNPDILLMIFEYVQFINNRLWSLITVSESVFQEYTKELLLGVDGDDSKDKLQALTLKTKILGALDDISAKLDGYYAIFYADNSDLEESVKRVSISPESIALNV